MCLHLDILICFYGFFLFKLITAVDLYIDLYRIISLLFIMQDFI